MHATLFVPVLQTGAMFTEEWAKVCSTRARTLHDTAQTSTTHCAVCCASCRRRLQAPGWLCRSLGACCAPWSLSRAFPRTGRGQRLLCARWPTPQRSTHVARASQERAHCDLTAIETDSFQLFLQTMFVFQEGKMTPSGRVFSKKELAIAGHFLRTVKPFCEKSY